MKSECPALDKVMARRRGQANVLNEDEEHGHDEEEEEEEECYIGEEIGTSMAEELFQVEEPEPGWVKESLLMDSGGSAPFPRNGAMSHIPVKPVSGEEKKRRWVNASGGKIKQTGISSIQFYTEDGQAKRMNLRRSAEVTKNIGSVAEICDSGSFCIFGPNGGAVIKDPDGVYAKWILDSAQSSTPFERTGNVYTMPMWVRVPAGGDDPGTNEKVADPNVRHQTCRGSGRASHLTKPAVAKQVGTEDATKGTAHKTTKATEKKGKRKELAETVDVVVRKGEDEGWKTISRKAGSVFSRLGY